MRKVLFGLAGALALALSALTAQPAEAQSLTISFGSGYGHGGWGGGYHGGYHRRAYYPRHVYRPRPVYYARPVYYPRPVYHAPVYRRVAYPVYAAPVYRGPRCVTRVKERWNGWRYVTVRTRTCY